MNECQPTSSDWLDEEPVEQEEFDSEPADQEWQEGGYADPLGLDRVRHPEITVRLSGGDGNAFMVLGTVQGALRRAGVPTEEIQEFFAEATGGDYDHLLATCMAWVSVE